MVWPVGSLQVDEARSDARVHLSCGDEDLDEYLHQLAADHFVQGLDLAVATGGDASSRRWPPEARSVSCADGAGRLSRDGSHAVGEGRYRLGSSHLCPGCWRLLRPPGWSSPSSGEAASDRVRAGPALHGGVLPATAGIYRHGRATARRPGAAGPVRGFGRALGGILEGMKPRAAAKRRILPGSPFNDIRPTQPIEQYAVQDRVTHDTYGLGRVVNAEEDAVTVDFGSHELRVVSPFHKLTKL